MITTAQKSHYDIKVNSLKIILISDRSLKIYGKLIKPDLTFH